MAMLALHYEGCGADARTGIDAMRHLSRGGSDEKGMPPMEVAKGGGAARPFEGHFFHILYQ
jgi:hypothetical protein